MTTTQGADQLVLVGGYTAETADMAGSAAGLTSWRLATAADGSPTLEPLDALGLPSPTYAVAHPGRPWVFTVGETSPATVTSLSWQPDGTLTRLSTVPAGGDLACHLALSPDLTRVVVASYGSGTVSSFAVDDEGRLSPLDVHQLQGSGPDLERQQGPHAHQVVFHEDEVWVSDLGTDRVHRLRLGPAGELTEAAPPVVLPAGSGPRHLVLLGEHLVVACELAGTLWLARRAADGSWTGLGSEPTTTVSSGAPLAPSALLADGGLVVVANRGPGTVSLFHLDADAGRLVRGAEVPCGGSGPRDLTLTAEHLWVANQADDVLTVFTRDALLGPDPRPVLEVATPSPARTVLLSATGR